MWKRKSVDPMRLQHKYANRPLFASFLAIPSVIVAFSQQKYYCALVPFSVFLTSVNYWRNPRYGLRRCIDIVTVTSGCIYNIYRSYESDNQVWYFATCLASVLCYLKARANADPDVSTAWHVGIHICANIDNILLYNTIKRNI